jgi:hypothetical protein
MTRTTFSVLPSARDRLSTTTRLTAKSGAVEASRTSTQDADKGEVFDMNDLKLS